MNILYIGNFGHEFGNDEFAVAWALESLGHRVERMHQEDAVHLYNRQILLRRHVYDFCLLNHFSLVPIIKYAAQRVPVVYWYFDLVDSNDPSLAPRIRQRVAKRSEIAPYCILGFHTDGDWVERWNSDGRSPPLIQLNQGADTRVTGFGRKPEDGENLTPILFTGVTHSDGSRRASHIEELSERYGALFEVVGNNGQRRLYGRELADRIARAKICVAPDGPSTQKYASDRIYKTTGFGGFMIHPYSEHLTHHFKDREEIVFYHSRAECNELIDYYLSHDNEREKIALAGMKRTLSQHTYIHRVAILVSLVERLLSVRTA